MNCSPLKSPLLGCASTVRCLANWVVRSPGLCGVLTIQTCDGFAIAMATWENAESDTTNTSLCAIASISFASAVILVFSSHAFPFSNILVAASSNATHLQEQKRTSVQYRKMGMSSTGNDRSNAGGRCAGPQSKARCVPCRMKSLAASTAVLRCLRNSSWPTASPAFVPPPPPCECAQLSQRTQGSIPNAYN